MQDDFDPNLARLIAAHPAIFHGRPPAVASYLSAGWYSLVDRLCCDIEKFLDANGLTHFECLQIKEKFGTLHFYWRCSCRGAPHTDLISSSEIASLEALPTKTARRLEKLRELVDAACSQSATICDTCGSPGRLLKQAGWRVTRCNDHTPDVDNADGL